MGYHRKTIKETKGKTPQMHAARVRRGDSHLPADTDKIVGGSKLLGQMRDLIRRKHYSFRTAQAYLGWAKRFILFHHKRHPENMGEAQIVAFLNHLAGHRNVAAFTQNQTLNALVFLNKQGPRPTASNNGYLL